MLKRTARETLLRIHPVSTLKPNHCTVTDYSPSWRGVEVACSCGERVFVDADTAHSKGLTIDTLKDGLRNAPRLKQS